MMEITIIPYHENYNSDFESLNVAWLEKYFSVEPIDKEIFADPKQYIIDKGGQIFFAKYGDAIVGTFAIIKTNIGYELAKMAVREDMQGKKVGNRMLVHCIETARHMGLQQIFLFSNTKLAPAIHLYKKFGFTEVPMGETGYKRSNIKMEKQL